MTRYTKLDPKNPAAGMRFTKTRKGQEKDRIRDELFEAMEKLGIRLSRPTLEILDKRLGARGLSEMLTEFQALIERLKPIATVTRNQPPILLSEESTAEIAEAYGKHFKTVIEIPPELRKK